MKTYIRPIAEVIDLQYEGLVAFSLRDGMPSADDPLNNFSNILLLEDEWDEED